MKLSVFNISRNLLCFFTAFLVSVIQLQLFGNNLFSLPFLFILLVTFPIVYLYFFSKDNVIFLFLYTLVIVFLLSLLGKRVDIRVLLAFLFCIAFLYAQSLFRSTLKNSAR